jgi:anti-sigma factor RsiW
MTASRRDPHLGELAAALVDGALDHDARDRAFSHVTRCEHCRTEVEAHRRLKARLAQLAPPSFPADLATRLRALPDRTPTTSFGGLPPDRFGARFRAPARLGGDGLVLSDRLLSAAGAGSRLATEPAAATLPAADRTVVAVRIPPDRPGADRPVSARPATTVGAKGPGRRALSSRRRRIAATAAGGLAAFALSLATVAVVGGGEEPEPVAPQVGTFIGEHSRVTGGIPGADQEAGAVDAASAGR